MQKTSGIIFNSSSPQTPNLNSVTEQKISVLTTQLTIFSVLFLNRLIADDDEPVMVPQEIAKDDELNLDILELVFAICNFTLELPSAVFDQLSSKNHPHYALIVMLFSFIALMSCIAELIYNGKKERVTWQWRGRVPWFYCQQTGKPFGTLLDMIGFACAFLPCILTVRRAQSKRAIYIYRAINYSFISRHLDGPINICVLPILLAFGLLCSKHLEKPDRNRGGNPTD
ncbi:Serine/threonine-protein kinase PBS1 [Theobroma cacao]|uniref:Serine/threonine-protein kinase PBS1 n=1 Tax=Theobroma cacao TaxID=3641 RepID=A0A061DYD7_THECC|nr:Serine/threonine-protein kinase PBS1 [Theobroma cacao]